MRASAKVVAVDGATAEVRAAAKLADDGRPTSGLVKEGEVLYACESHYPFVNGLRLRKTHFR